MCKTSSVKFLSGEKLSRSIKLNSPEIVNGSLKGKFEINELPKLIGNSVGDIYTKFSSYQVKENQYLDFNFEIYSKIIELFYPALQLGSNTKFKGRFI
mgnify:CR=1 FL=1